MVRALQELLNGVTAEQAAAKPVSGAHNIFELVLHITAWVREALAVVEGKTYETLKGEKDWPPVTETWQAALDDLGSTTKALVATIRAMPDEKLNDQPAARSTISIFCCTAWCSTTCIMPARSHC